MNLVLKKWTYQSNQEDHRKKKKKGFQGKGRGSTWTNFAKKKYLSEKVNRLKKSENRAIRTKWAGEKQGATHSGRERKKQPIRAPFWGRGRKQSRRKKKKRIIVNPEREKAGERMSSSYVERNMGKSREEGKRPMGTEILRKEGARLEDSGEIFLKREAQDQKGSG